MKDITKREMDLTGEHALKQVKSTGKSTATSAYQELRPHINLDFVDLSYPVNNLSKMNDKKKILRGVSGSFRSGELTAILGTSGAGKSTLLNILTGYMSVGATGSIRINGHPCQMKDFRKMSSYIMQDDLIQPYLTVEESLKVVADLKLGKDYSENDKREVINEILETLGLEKHKTTRTESLSGGQRKRVSIALELVSNPPAIFLDEPTTGLDVVSTTQVVQLLQKLARQGRTVVCTIHQPSAGICKYFDHMYVMTRGCCVYQGPYQKLVPFMSFVGYDCPTTYNPADYVIEVITSSSKATTTKMSQFVQNGKMSVGSGAEGVEDGNLQKALRQNKVSVPIMCLKEDLSLPVSFFKQFAVLFNRKMKQQFRNKLAIVILLAHHVLTGALLGIMFQGVGNDANRPFENFKYLISVVVFFMYTHVMCPVLLFPLEVKMMKREYFNRWYSLRAYFAAFTAASAPFQIIFGLAFILISYALSDQPVETSRIMYFVLIGILLGFTSEGWGLTVGSLFSTRNGSIVGPASIVPLLAVSVYGMGFGGAIEPFMKILMSLSYLRYGVVGFSTTVYSQNRTLICDNDKYVYCHYANPELLLKDLGMEGDTTLQQIMALVFFMVLYRMTAYLGLRFRLNVEFAKELSNLASKLLCYLRFTIMIVLPISKVPHHSTIYQQQTNIE